MLVPYLSILLARNLTDVVSFCIFGSRKSVTITLPFFILVSCLDRVSFHSYLLECCPLYAISTVSIFFRPDSPLLQQRQRRTLQIVLLEKRNASREFSAPCIGPPYFPVGCGLEIHIFEQYLECTAATMASAVLAVEADDNGYFTELHLRDASSSR